MGFFHWHNIAGIGSYPGLPDRVAIKNGIVLFIEIKGPYGIHSAHQKKFQRDLEYKGGHYILAQGYEDIENYLKERNLWEKLSPPF